MLVEASMNIDDFMEEMGIYPMKIWNRKTSPLWGISHVPDWPYPEAGDIFTYKNLQFEVVDMDRGRVGQTACHQTGRRAGIG